MFLGNTHKISMIGNKGIVTNGLVLHLDAGISASYPGTGTTWYDLSGNGVNATLYNGVTFNSSNGGYLTFNGTNQYGLVADIDGITDFNSTNNYTVDFWVNMNATQNNTTYVEHDVIEKWSGSGGYPYTLRYYRQSQSFGAALYNGSSAQGANIAISHSSWWNVCSVFDRSNNLLTMYGNNNQVTTSIALTLTGNITNTSALNLMRRGNNIAYATGSLSSLHIYNRALSAGEVAQNYNALKGRYGL